METYSRLWISREWRSLYYYKTQAKTKGETSPSLVVFKAGSGVVFDLSIPDLYLLPKFTLTSSEGSGKR